MVWVGKNHGNINIFLWDLEHHGDIGEVFVLNSIQKSVFKQWVVSNAKDTSTPHLETQERRPAEQVQ